jgi:DNA modification methylase
VIQLHCGDCLEILPTLGGIDALIVDPPYGIALADHQPSFSRRKLSAKIRGDSDQSVGIRILEWAAGEGLPTAAFASPYRQWPGRWRNVLVWDKGPAVGRGGDPKKCWKRTFELIQIARNGPLRKGRGEAVIREFVRPDHFTLHPAAKPVGLMVNLIEQLTDPGDTVLDPCMGSGSTGLACLMAGRHFIGIEIDPAYFAIARDRIAAAQASTASA